MRPRHQMHQHLSIRGGLHQAACLHQRLPQAFGIGQITVMRQRKAAKCQLGDKRLNISNLRLPCGGIAVMPNRGKSGQLVQIT